MQLSSAVTMIRIIQLTSRQNDGLQGKTLFQFIRVKMKTVLEIGADKQSYIIVLGFSITKYW